MGRQITRKEFGYNLIKKALEQLQTSAKIEIEPKWQGKLLMTILAPLKKNNAKTKN